MSVAGCRDDHDEYFENLSTAAARRTNKQPETHPTTGPPTHRLTANRNISQRH